MAAKLRGVSKMWSTVAVSRREPYILTHGFNGHVPGSFAAIKMFKPCSLTTVKVRAYAFLETQVQDWKARTFYDPVSGGYRQSGLEDIVDAMLTEFMTPFQVTEEPIAQYATPAGVVWAGMTAARVHKNVIFAPIVQLQLEENPAPNVKPRVVAVHVQFPLKPSVVLAAAELLSCSFRPGEHRLLAHAPRVDKRTTAESVAANAILFSRVSAFADFACTESTDLHCEMLRHGGSMRDLRSHVAAQGGRWVLRNVQFARTPVAAPAQAHPSGCVDGSKDYIPDDEV